jgi:SNF2 family DNA or RNA helicase
MTYKLQVSLLSHWQATLVRFAPDMIVHVHASCSASDDAALSSADVIVTTPSMLLQPRSSSLIARKFWRLVVDEAHLVANPKTLIYQTLFSLKCVHFWGISGTPLQNKSGDVRALLQLCRVPWALLPRKESLKAAAGACWDEFVMMMASPIMAMVTVVVATVVAVEVELSVEVSVT